MRTSLLCIIIGIFWIVMSFIASSSMILSVGYVVIANVWLAASYIVPDHFTLRGRNQ